MKVLKYDNKFESNWDNFVRDSKNGHFFFFRKYMEYHSDRFTDFSLLVFDDNDKLISILPANIKDNTVYSHQGLTFSGFIVNDKMKTEIMFNVFTVAIEYLKENGVKKFVYKCIPYIYHLKPSEEDRYALFRYNSKLIRRDITSTIDLSTQVRYSKGRKWTINKAKKEDLEIFESTDYSIFWELLINVLESNHETKPVHSLDEIVYLSESFQKNIKLYMIKKGDHILSGAVIFENTNIAHTQYLANSDLGREIGALDFLLDYLIKEKYSKKKYFDFGISNEDEGRVLNSGLISQKEGFGARAVSHDFYELEIK